MYISNSTLIAGLKRRRISHSQFAKACGLNPSTVSSVINGWLRVGPKTRDKLTTGMTSLGFSLTEIGQILDQQQKKYS
jgi:DNA-binding LacI/PurR family transcriptional regulator